MCRICVDFGFVNLPKLHREGMNSDMKYYDLQRYVCNINFVLLLASREPPI